MRMRMRNRPRSSFIRASAEGGAPLAEWPSGGAYRRRWALMRFLRWTVFAMLLATSAAAVPDVSRTPPFQPGEELVFQVGIFSVAVGKIRVSVHRDLSGDVPIWPIEMSGRTEGLAGAFYKVDDAVTTRFDPATRLSV